MFNIELMIPPRKRLNYLGYIILTIGLGLFSRTQFIPEFIYPYLGDMFYCLMFYFIFGFLFPKEISVKVLLYSVLVCYIIELTQLIENDWLDKIRQTTFGKLTLGSGFLWSDLVSYVIGGLLGFGLEFFFIKNRKAGK